MEHNTPSNPTPASDDAAVPTLTPDQERRAVLDAHGYDPADFDWVPVRRKPRVDGWSPEKQRLFIGALMDTGSVTHAARAVGMSVKSAYELRRAPDGAGFDRAWVAAIRHAMQRLIDVCMERALEGTLEPVWDRQGNHIGNKTRHHDRMAMFLLRAHMPELFRADAAASPRPDPAKPDAATPEPAAAALARLDPVQPAQPEAMMPPDQLDAALETATMLDGKLPHWRRDPDLVAREREREAAAVDTPDVPPMGEEFERRLEAAKDGTYDARYGPKRRRKRRAA